MRRSMLSISTRPSGRATRNPRTSSIRANGSRHRSGGVVAAEILGNQPRKPVSVPAEPQRIRQLSEACERQGARAPRRRSVYMSAEIEQTGKAIEVATMLGDSVVDVKHC